MTKHTDDELIAIAPARDAMLNRTDEEWDALFDAISTVNGLRAGHTLTEADYAALQLVDKCHREDEETATDCYHRGRQEALLERGGADLVALHKRIDDMAVKVAMANTKRLVAEARARTAVVALRSAESFIADGGLAESEPGASIYQQIRRALSDNAKKEA